MHFEARHTGPDAQERAQISRVIGVRDNDDLARQVVPASILTNEPLDLPGAVSETEVLQLLGNIAARNTVRRAMIGTGYYGTITPPVVLRNVLENPAWY
ncbi:MAG: glycine dehydrogenase (aminomethyl-transferring), partial [Actinobacteria bacterium]|nr:glycine dehydrogenase (aminomethyl-transferring) [Actinomycetota bacterium]